MKRLSHNACVLVTDGGQCLAGQQHGTEQQAQDEGLATCGLCHDGYLCGFLLYPGNFPGLVPILGRWGHCHN